MAPPSIGVAVSDEMKLSRTPLELNPAKPPVGVMETPRQLIQEKDVEQIVMGPAAQHGRQHGPDGGKGARVRPTTCAPRSPCRWCYGMSG
jgi:RNase H-fold protein (predicted Holliday junction resolvase)